MISLYQAFANWQELAQSIPKDDGPALAESWNDYTDSLCKDGELCALQYHHAPAYDDAMPGEGSRFDPLSDDRDFILSAMNVTLAAEFVPFSQSRNKDEKGPSLNWKITLRKDGRDVLSCDYMQGCAHCPAYNLSVKEAGNRDSILRDNLIRRECETGKTARPALIGGKKIDPPDLADVFYSLLLESSAIDSGGFADWCAEYGYSEDSIKARAMFDSCIDTALKLRGAFGESTLAQLRELFEDM
jgi:hypothetical protein